ncbi:hypothetical protein [Nannocystis pusilla]|uniref:hypothetical protein n=1 Tax=Nannocystis pusilla TaxID=889268 RepID=UPI003B7ABFE4
MIELLIAESVLVGGLRFPTRFTSPWDALAQAAGALSPAEAGPWRAAAHDLRAQCEALGERAQSMAPAALAAALAAAGTRVGALAGTLGLGEIAQPRVALRCDTTAPLDIALGRDLAATIAATAAELTGFTAHLGMGGALGPALVDRWLGAAGRDLAGFEPPPLLRDQVTLATWEGLGEELGPELAARAAAWAERLTASEAAELTTPAQPAGGGDTPLGCLLFTIGRAEAGGEATRVRAEGLDAASDQGSIDERGAAVMVADARGEATIDAANDATIELAASESRPPGVTRLSASCKRARPSWPRASTARGWCCAGWCATRRRRSLAAPACSSPRAGRSRAGCASNTPESRTSRASIRPPWASPTPVPTYRRARASCRTLSTSGPPTARQSTCAAPGSSATRGRAPRCVACPGASVRWRSTASPQRSRRTTRATTCCWCRRCARRRRSPRRPARLPRRGRGAAAQPARAPARRRGRPHAPQRARRRRIEKIVDAAPGPARFAAWQRLAVARGWPELVLVHRDAEPPLLVPRDAPLAVEAMSEGAGEAACITVEEFIDDAWICTAAGERHVAELALSVVRPALLERLGAAVAAGQRLADCA